MNHYPLTEEQSEMFQEWDLNHQMTQYNMSCFMQCPDRWITPEMFRKAVAEVVDKNLYLRNRFVRVAESEVPPQKHYNDPTRLIRQYPELSQ